MAWMLAERVLGSRSILANPLNLYSTENVNSVVSQRHDRVVFLLEK